MGPTRHTVLVTGGSGTIGRNLCRRFAEAGWHVGVHYHQHLKEAERTASLVSALNIPVSLHRADVTQRTQVEQMIKEFTELSGGFDVLICSAGQTQEGLVLRTSASSWASMIATNLTGAYHCVQAAGRIMEPRGSGAIVLLGSWSSLHGRRGLAPYTASKAGLVGLARTAAREWGQAHIRVNLLLPGWHVSAMTGEQSPLDEPTSPHTLDHLSDLNDISETAFHLATNSSVSGQIWNCDSRIP